MLGDGNWQMPAGYTIAVRVNQKNEKERKLLHFNIEPNVHTTAHLRPNQYINTQNVERGHTSMYTYYMEEEMKNQRVSVDIQPS